MTLELLLEDPAPAHLFAARFHVALLHAHLLDAHATAFAIDGHHPSLFSAVGPGDHLHEVAFANASCHLLLLGGRDG